jgi:hypothetical protein
MYQRDREIIAVARPHLAVSGTGSSSVAQVAYRGQGSDRHPRPKGRIQRKIDIENGNFFSITSVFSPPSADMRRAIYPRGPSMVIETIEAVEISNAIDESPAVSWAAVVAGAVAAAALTLVLLAFGAGMGFSSVSP